MYDYNTSNKSFTDLYKKLSRMGIENREYLLLNNEHLRDVDPWDENISEHEKAEIIQECEENIWYFLREVLRMPYDLISKTNPKFGINIGVFSMIYLWLNGYNQMTIMPSTMFKTGTICALYVYLKYILGLSLSNINITSQNSVKAKHTKSKLNTYGVPSYLKSSVDKNNSEKHILLDEFAQIPNNSKVWNRVKNKDNVVILTTAGDMKTDSGKFAYTLKNNSTPWNIKYVDRNKAYLDDIYSKSDVPLFSVSYSATQLGVLPEILKRKIEATKSIISRDSLDRKVDLIWK